MVQNLNNRKSILHFRITSAALLALILGGCSFFGFSMPSPEEQSEKLTEVMEKGGYAPTRGLAIDSAHDVWLHDKTEFDVTMTAPTAPGSYPLIIYLPGLGEDAKAGQLWRETWAKAGYAVFSMQTLAVGQALKTLKELGSELDDTAGELDDGEQLGSSDEMGRDRAEEGRSWFGGDKPRRPSRTARNSEMRYLGHEYFGSENLKNRMEQLFWAFRQLKSRVNLHQPLYVSADLSKVVLAGYDLGAQTISAVMGENFETALPTSGELKPMAAIMLSPSVNLATGNVRSRFQKMNLPMLVITGTEDNDPYAISSGSVRTAIWEYAPVGGKYLLLLKDAGHRVLAGSEMGGRFGRERSDGTNGFPGSMGMGGGRSRNGGRGMDGGGGMMGAFAGGGERRNPDLGYKHVAAISSASTAFLDAVIKNDEFARFWINDKANHWLDKAGSLRIR